MPKLKQPSSLLDVSMVVLVGFLTKLCDRLSSDDCSGSLRQAVAFIKNDMCPLIPFNLAAEFCSRFFEAFGNINDLRLHRRPHAHQKAVLEMIMDRKITGLRFESATMHGLDPCDEHRFQGLRVLNLSCVDGSRVNLDNVLLQDLTTFIFEKLCTDADLDVIGRNCPKLVHLNVQSSHQVTDRGLRFLNSCSELRFVRLSKCRVTFTGISQFLSMHSKVEMLYAWKNGAEAGFDCLSRPASSVYPSIKAFFIKSDRFVPDSFLRSVVAKFPNLTSLGIPGELTGDLSILTPLSKLSKLDLSEAYAFSWVNLKNFLVLQGDNITDLALQLSIDTQSDLNFVFQYCRNIENLKFFCHLNHRDKSVVPPFGKLTNLSCILLFYASRESRVIRDQIGFVNLPKLESLCIREFHITEEDVKSLIFDDDKFPELKIMDISPIAGPSGAVDRIMQTVKIRNLDFKLTSSD